LLSSDHVETARKVAIETGILSSEEDLCLDSETFRSEIGGITYKVDIYGN